MEDITRRKAIAGIGGLTTAALAGCASSDDSDTASGNGGNGGNGDEESGNGNGNGNGGDENGVNAEDESGSVEILEHEVVEPDIGSYVEIHGLIENNTGEEQSYIELSAVFHDAEGTRVDDTFTNFTDVPDGEKISFEIMTTVEPDEFDEYELETSTSV